MSESQIGSLKLSISTCYLDESTDEGSLEFCYTVAGWLGADDAFLELDFKWGDFLRKNGIAYFKASECEGGLEEFAKFRDDPEDMTRPLSGKEKGDLTAIKIQAIDAIVGQRDIFGLGTVLMLPDYARIKNEFAPRLLLTPYFLCGQLTLVAAGFMMNAWNDPNPQLSALLRPIFDSHEIYSGRAKEVFDSFKEKNPRSSACMLPPHYESDLEYRALQVADVLAYEARRLLVRSEYAKNFTQNRAWERLREKVEVLYKLDYRTLKMICEKAAPDTIPIDPAIKDGRLLPDV